ncbi:hypothetical protein ABZ851_15120 [Streptomyces sp. NPDC047049]|uniref:hypothetical protein n=1 Tax=Streptomyces sp. NPDC047049 TaxID=3156688 RepID=UPI0033ED377F
MAFATATVRFATGASQFRTNASPGLTVRLVLTVVCGPLAILSAVDLILVLRNDRVVLGEQSVEFTIG